MTVARRSPKAAFDLVRAYTADGDEHMAMRTYTESRLSYTRFLEALKQGRAARGKDDG